MRIKVKTQPTPIRTRSLELEEGSTAIDAIRAMGLFPDAWIPLNDDRPVPLDHVLKDGDEIRLIAVVSGG
jgi:sulfur carrier protein ThiS